MQPNQPQYSIDYLNQIAPVQKRRTGNDKFFFGVLGIGLVLALIIGIVVLSNSSGKPNLTERLENLSSQLATLQKISTDANSSIHDNHLQSMNANLAIQLTNANQAIATPLKNNGVSETIPPAIAAQNTDSDFISKLQDAKLNAVYDRVYSTNMTYELSSLLIYMRGIERDANSKSLKTFIDSTVSNLQPIYTEMQSFSNQGN